MRTRRVVECAGWLAAAVLTLGLLLAGCAPGPQDASAEALNVTVSIVPQAYFVERIGGDHVTVNVMVEPGSSPATYEPRPEQLKALADAVAYFSIGVPFENVWLDRIAAANQDMRIVDTAAGIDRLPMRAHHHHDDADEHHDEADEHHDEVDHDHAVGPPDPHIWLSPRLVKVQAQNIYAALAQIDSENEAQYQANLDAFLDDITALEADIEATLTGLQSHKFMVFHPAWGYFAADFGLEQIPIEIGGQEPSARELAALIEHARQEDIQVVFAQPEFRTSDAETIAQEIDGEVLLISPLAPDWLDNLQRVAQTFADVLE